MKNIVCFILLKSLIAITSAASELLRSADVKGLRFRIFSGDEGMSMEAVSLSTGAKFGPVSVYETISRDVVEENIQDDISVESVGKSSITAKPPMYNEAVEMKEMDQTPEQKRMNKQDVLIEDLMSQVNVLQTKRIETGSVGMSYANDTNGTYTLHTGSEDRYYTIPVTFGTAFTAVPIVTVSVKSIDADGAYNTRINAWAQNLREDGCDIVTQTWGDSLIYQFEVVWHASS